MSRNSARASRSIIIPEDRFAIHQRAALDIVQP